MAAIKLHDLRKVYPDGSVAVDDVSLEIADGELMILVGPSGCGKSTLLRMIAGLEEISEGELFIDGEVVNDKAPRERNLAMVFQSYALYPHLTVFENIAFPLRLAGRLDEGAVRAKVEQAARMLALEALLGRKPSQLSGGQRQRVAMGRAIVRNANAFLFDEPLSNLDAKLRAQMRTEIARLQRKLGTTIVYVTHDQTEAMTLGDRVAVLKRGVLQQVASPRELYEQPANLFVAGFIGSPAMNFLPARIDGRELALPFATLELPAETAERARGRGLLLAGIRPELFEDAALVDGPRRALGLTFEADIDVTEWLGSELFAYAPFEAPAAIVEELARLARELDGESLRTQLVLSLDGASRIRAGERALLWLDPRQLHLFDPASGENLTLPR